MVNKIYKYKPLGNERKSLKNDDFMQCLLDIVNHSRLYIPTRKELNDPFEGLARPICLGIIGEGVMASAGFIHPIIEDWFDEYRILSFSEAWNIPQMWANYANNYNGVCLEFEIKTAFKNIQKVTYIEKRLETVYDPDVDEIDSIIRDNLLYKSKNWSYEREWRILHTSKSKYISFDSDELKRIIIGNKVGEKDKEIIVNAARKRKILVSKLMIDAYNYNLKAVPVDFELCIGGNRLDDEIIDMDS